MATSSLLQQILFISLLSTTITITHTYTTPCPDDQKTLLFKLKNDLIFDSSLSRKLVLWNQTDNCCIWEGVECDGRGHIISLQLDYEAISGGLESSSSLFSLTYLKKLNLAFNNFNGTQIPRGIGNLTYLTHLNLSYANFGGQIPIQISLLTRLVSLDVSNSYYPSHDQRTMVSNLFIQPPQHDYWGQKMLRLSLSIDIYNTYFYDPDDKIIWQWSIHPLKLDHLLLQNLTRLRELYLDSTYMSSEWCHTISSSLPNLTTLSLRDCNLSGHLHSSLLQLHSLSVLRLDWNNLSTAVLDFVSNFSNLSTLSLKYCSLKGSVPDKIFQVPTLKKLDLSYNQLLGGPIPQTLSTSTELVHLDLSNNMFTGLVPSFYMCKKLAYIDLSRNNLTGQLSSIHFEGLSNVVYISLGANAISGNIPESLFDLTSVQTLALNRNQISGSLKLEKIQRLSNLLDFGLSDNFLSVDVSSGFPAFPKLRSLGLASCNLHGFPDLRNQSSLKILDLSSNMITGEIPGWIWEIGNGELYFLNLSCNHLLDTQKPYRMPANLALLDLNTSLLRGELSQFVPESISNLYYFSIANNNLSGSIPTSLCNARNLELLDLSFNGLTGNIPPCLLENIQNLEVLSLRRNNINGEIPDQFSVNCGLETLDLSENNLHGSIPKSLANCKLLMAMNVGSNHINGSFPCMLPSSLRILILRSNMFNGQITLCNSWPNLQIIDIASNNFSGDLNPISFESWRGMMKDSPAGLFQNIPSFFFGNKFYYYQYEVSLTIKSLKLSLAKIRGDFTTIDFSSNNFQGRIPAGIGDLGSLYLLNLSHNAFTGSIPESLGNLTELGSLDLSTNELTGVIPKELAKLTFLSVLNLSHNRLVGEIPNGRQLQTFSSDSFEGNMGLCGLPLNMSCKNSDENGPRLENVEADHAEIEWDYVSAALGFVVGLGSFVWVLLGCTTFRHKYYDKVDEILEKIFKNGDKKRRDARRRTIKNQVRRQ